MLAIIGGTGIYALDGLELQAKHEADTPFGAPSGPVLVGVYGGQRMLFLARHGEGHRLLPHEVNYRANVFALKAAGATAILGVSAVGSLHADIAPGHLAMPTQYFDWTRGVRERSFFGNGVIAHVSTAEPVSHALSLWVQRHAAGVGIKMHGDVTYGCVEGPRLGTKAESHFLRQAGCHLVGMTNVPEVFLAREAQMAYASIGIVTDYDCWMEDPAMHVSVANMMVRYAESLATVRRLLDRVLRDDLPEFEPEIRRCLAQSLLTPAEAMSDAQRGWLSVLQR